MREFQVLFDEAEPSVLEHPAYRRYGGLGFPAAPPERPWVFTNFVQTLDGVASLRGRHASGGDIAQSPEDRWLMDLLRAHADCVLLGLKTLTDEKLLRGTARGPVFAIADPECRDLRQRLGRGRECNVFVTGNVGINLDEFKVFDGERLDAVIVTTRTGADRLRERRSHPQVRVVVAGEDKFVDLRRAIRTLRSDLGFQHVLCEGGPTLNGFLAKEDLVDERFLTVSPLEAGLAWPSRQEALPNEQHGTPRPTTLPTIGFTKDEMTRWRWMSCRRIGDHQFHRLRRMR